MWVVIVGLQIASSVLHRPSPSKHILRLQSLWQPDDGPSRHAHSYLCIKCRSPDCHGWPGCCNLCNARQDMARSCTRCITSDCISMQYRTISTTDGPWQLVGSELCVTHLCSLAIFLPHQHRQTPTSDGRNPTWAQCAFADVSGYEAGTQGWNELGYVLQDVSTEPVSD